MGSKSSKEAGKSSNHSDKKKDDYCSDHGTKSVELAAVEEEEVSKNTSSENEKESKVEQEDVPEAVESDSRITTGSESNISQNEVEAEPVTETDSDLVTSSERESSEDEDETPEEYDSGTVPDEHVEEHEELMSALEEAMENQVKEGDVKSSLVTSADDNRERIASGADVAGYQYQERLQENSSMEICTENELSERDLSDTSYPIQSEHREKGMILITVDGPRADSTQLFWQMIVEKQIPTIHMTCDYVERGILKCAPYIPIHGESEIDCGVYTIKRLGTESQLSMNLKRQQLLIYEETEGFGSKYKHSVTHFQEKTSANFDENQHARNTNVIHKHVSHQPNPQLLVHGSW